MGIISMEKLEEDIKNDNDMVKVMYVKNEIGVRKNIRKIGEI
jgi:cysteine sulfinate desulfinase/cysteine desulfurase-like protein